MTIPTPWSDNDTFSIDDVGPMPGYGDLLSKAAYIADKAGARSTAQVFREEARWNRAQDARR